MLQTDARGERIPLTIADADANKGTITLIAQAAGATTNRLAQMEVGDELEHLLGPLGTATDIKKLGTILCCGGGVGIAPLFPIVQAFKQAGNRVVVVLAARSKELIILEEEMRKYADELIIMTDDGSYGKKGLVTEGMEQIITQEKIDECVVIGPTIMMKFAALVTKKYDIPTQASLNTLMVDGTGMCGACRVTVDGVTRFTCVEGPEFDAHKIDFDEVLLRLGAYKDEEQILSKRTFECKCKKELLTESN